MGYYLNSTGSAGLPAQGKADCLIADCKAVRIPRPVNFPNLPELALICIVDNGLFEAAALIYNEREFKEFSISDGRQKIWLTMDKKLAHELAGYKGGRGMKKPKPIPPMTMVTFTPCAAIHEWMDQHPEERKVHYPFTMTNHYLCLGEIRGMSGHIAVVDSKGLIRWAYHTEDFTPVPKDEL